MSNKKDHEFKENLDRCYRIVQQSSTKGISAVEVAEKMGKHRTTVHGYLNTLEYRGRIESQHGVWYAKAGEQTIEPVEKEIVIELPMTEDHWRPVTLLETLAQDSEENGMPEMAKTYRTPIETLKETRTIRIKGKNVDDLDLERIADLIQQATKRSSKFDLKGLFKSLKEQLPSKKKIKLDFPDQTTVPNEH